MKKRTTFALLAVAAVLLGCFTAGAWMLRHGFSARDEPTAVEAFVASRLRHFAIPRSAREAKNPILRTPEVLGEAMAHFADHCSQCHGNDGRGWTEMGQRLYPRAPDMATDRSQSL